MAEEDDIVSEAAEYSPKSEFSKPKIVAEAVSKCIEARGKEMRSGYWNTTLTKDNLPIRTWIIDSRKAFIGCVIALKNLMAPEVARSMNPTEEDKKKDAFKFKDIDTKSIFDRYAYSERVKQRETKTNRIIWKETGIKIIPERDSIVILPDVNQMGIAVEKVGAWNNYINAYWDEMVIVHDKIFAELNKLIDDLNYFKQKTRFN